MKILIASPYEYSHGLVGRMREQGHKIVIYGQGEPRVEKKDLYTFASLADLVLVDAPFRIERTRRSWKPSRDALSFDELRRKHAIRVLGSTPTTDLLCGDQRYLKKWCLRLGIPYDPDAKGEPWTSGAWFRQQEIVPPGPYLEAWKPLFKSVGFRGWFALDGVLTPEGPIVGHCTTIMPLDQIPDGKEEAFFMEMARCS